MPADGVVLPGRVETGPGEVPVEGVVEGVVDEVSEPAGISTTALVTTVVVVVDGDVLGGDVEVVDGVSSCSGCPGFCQTDLVVASPIAGKSASRSASAEPAEPSATTARTTVPAVRRSCLENRGAAEGAATDWWGCDRTTDVSRFESVCPCWAQSRLACVLGWPHGLVGLCGRSTPALCSEVRPSDNQTLVLVPGVGPARSAQPGPARPITTAALRPRSSPPS